MSILLLIVRFLLPRSLVLSSFQKSGIVSEGKPRISPWPALCAAPLSTLLWEM